MNIEDVAKVSNAGVIEGGVRGVSIGATGSSGPFAAEIFNSGTISGGTSGIESFKALKVTNSGDIVAVPSNSVLGRSGILSTKEVTVDNSGRILATGGNACDQRSGSADVVNSAGGTISGAVGGIFAPTPLA